jgi:hypothetical protein
MTPFENKCKILSDLWLGRGGADENFTDFIEYNDIGLPMAHFLSAKYVEVSPTAEQFVNETFDLFLASLGLEDTGFDNLGELLD